jgi:hypothetical protein
MTEGEGEIIARVVREAVHGEFEMLHAKVAHLVERADTAAHKLEASERAQEERTRAVRELQAQQRAVSQRLTQAALQMMAARAVEVVAPNARKVVALLVGAAVGAYAALMTLGVLHLR